MLNVNDLKNRKLFDGIQGNILKAHGRHHTANLFIRCSDGRQAETKAWLRSLVEGDNAIVQSGDAQLQSTILWKEKKIDTGLFACIHISAAGYDYLFGEGRRDIFADIAFRNGMKAAALNDPHVQLWDAGLRIDNHFMLLLAHSKPDALATAIETISQTIQAFATITIEKGEALFNKANAGLEHFGYVDGISQPLFFDDEWETYKADNNIKSEADILFDPRAKKGLVLVEDPFVHGDKYARGSYFVFRKLEQNVKGFKLAEEMLAEQLGLTGEDEERAGAMLVGRFEDGTPVQLSDEAGLANSAVANNFDYDLTDASKCPFHGHIRKTNPRSSMPAGSGGVDEAKTHIMARRGIPFGIRVDDPNDGLIDNKPEGGVGLLFMSYQASIGNQFEFIQKNWANNPDFPHFDPNAPDGVDLIIGQDGQKYATEWGKPETQSGSGFGRFVHMKGGEYFFAPSMSFLKAVETIQ